MGWGTKAIEIRSSLDGEEIGSFKHKRAMRVSYMCTHPYNVSPRPRVCSCAFSVRETTRFTLHPCSPGAPLR